MDEKNEEVVKNRFSQARRSYGKGRSLVRECGSQRFFNRLFLAD
jgi:hypothetical protein